MRPFLFKKGVEMALPNRIRTNVGRNLRRQIDRKIAQTERIRDSINDKTLRQSYEQKLSRLSDAREKTYITELNDAGKRVTRTDEEIRRNFQEASQEISQSRYLSQRGHRNLVSTQSQLNAASAGAVSEYTQAEVRIFYRATQNAWQKPGVKVEDRNKAILEHYGYENLSELVSDILTLNQKAVDKSRQMSEETLTKEQSDATSDNDVKEAQQSPEYLLDVISMSDPSGLDTLEKSE